MRERRQVFYRPSTGSCGASGKCWTGELLTPLLSLGLAILFALAGVLWQLLRLGFRSLYFAISEKRVRSA